MTSAAGQQAASASSSPELYEAARATDGTDAVDRGNRLNRTEAESRRSQGLDIVVCGPDDGANWQLAREIEAAVVRSSGGMVAHGPHLGAQSLAHWQQKTGDPPGQSFYETQLRKARGIP